MQVSKLIPFVQTYPITAQKTIRPLSNNLNTQFNRCQISLRSNGQQIVPNLVETTQNNIFPSTTISFMHLNQEIGHLKYSIIKSDQNSPFQDAAPKGYLNGCVCIEDLLSPKAHIYKGVGATLLNYVFGRTYDQTQGKMVLIAHNNFKGDMYQIPKEYNTNPLLFYTKYGFRANSKFYANIINDSIEEYKKNGTTIPALKFKLFLPYEKIQELKTKLTDKSRV